MALLILATVFVGFARTYYLAGVFHAPLPSLIIHLHGAAFSTWILLLVTQTSWSPPAAWTFIAAWALRASSWRGLMVTLGVLAATDSLVRHGGPPGLDAKLFYVIPMTDMLIFAT